MGMPLAVDGCTLEISSGGSGPAPTVVNTPSDSIDVSGKGVFFKEIKFSVMGVTAGDITNADGRGEGTISGTGENIDENGDYAVLEGDESEEITVEGTKSSPSGPVHASGKIKVKVKSAGQTDVIAL